MDFSDVVILAVKPFIIPRVLQDVKSKILPSKLVMSIAAGVKINVIESELTADSKVSRIIAQCSILIMTRHHLKIQGNRKSTNKLISKFSISMDF